MEIDEESASKKEVKLINCENNEPEKTNAFKKKLRKYTQDQIELETTPWKCNTGNSDTD